MTTGINGDVSKFADDTKIGRPVKNLEDTRMLQGDVNRLYEWSEKWQMQFYVKCSIMGRWWYSGLALGSASLGSRVRIFVIR